MYLVLLVEIKQWGGRLWVCKVRLAKYYGGVDLAKFHVIVELLKRFKFFTHFGN
jgi:hypothetical protein